MLMTAWSFFQQPPSHVTTLLNQNSTIVRRENALIKYNRVDVCVVRHDARLWRRISVWPPVRVVISGDFSWRKWDAVAWLVKRACLYEGIHARRIGCGRTSERRAIDKVHVTCDCSTNKHGSVPAIKEEKKEKEENSEETRIQISIKPSTQVLLHCWSRASDTWWPLRRSRAD